MAPRRDLSAELLITAALKSQQRGSQELPGYSDPHTRFSEVGREGGQLLLCVLMEKICVGEGLQIFFKILLSIYLQHQQVRLVKMLLSVIQALLVSGFCG